MDVTVEEILDWKLGSLYSILVLPLFRWSFWNLNISEAQLQWLNRWVNSLVCPPQKVWWKSDELINEMWSAVEAQERTLPSPNFLNP